MERLCRIKPLDAAAQNECERRFNAIAMPLGGLGLLQDIFVKAAGITGSADVTFRRSACAVMCGDHGVTAQGVTQTDSSVTAIVARDINLGKSTVNALAEGLDITITAYDMGMHSDVAEVPRYKTAYGTADITKSAAMTREQAVSAISYAMDIVRDLAEKGNSVIIAGEMGIGNTTAASAITSVLLSRPVEEMTGRGAGLSSEGLSRKIAAVHKAIEVNAPDKSEPLDVLAKIGGFDIAGMVGLYLGGAVYRVPIIVDGVVSAAAAAVAYAIEPKSRDFMLPSHISSEPSGKALMEYLGLSAPICAAMHIGEGTGGIMLLRMLQGAENLYYNGRRFENSGIEQYKEYK